MRLRRKPPTNPQRIANLFFAIDRPLDRGQPNIIDLRIRAPVRATGDRNLELSWQVIELGIRRQLLRYLNRQRRGIEQLMPVKSSEWASSDVANHIAARPLRTQTNRRQRIDNLWQRVNRQPVQLNVLPCRDVCKIPRVLLRKVPDHPQLRTRQNAIRQPDAHHEELSGLTLAGRSTRYPRAISLRVDAPPLEIKPGPLRKDRAAALLCELANLIPRLPGVLGELQPLGFLCFGLFHDWCSGGAHARILMKMELMD